MVTKHAPLPLDHEKISKKIVDAAYTVHRNLGPGLLESVYEPCLCPYSADTHLSQVNGKTFRILDQLQCTNHQARYKKSHLVKIENN